MDLAGGGSGEPDPHQSKRQFWGYISQLTVKHKEYPAWTQYSQPYLVGDSSDMAFHYSSQSSLLSLSGLLLQRWLH